MAGLELRSTFLHRLDSARTRPLGLPTNIKWMILAPPPTESVNEKWNGNRSHYSESSNRAQLLPPVSVRLSPAPCPVEGGKMGVHATRLHGGRPPVADTGVSVAWPDPIPHLGAE